MSILLNQYTKDTEVHFNDLVVQSNEALTYLVGQMANEGMIGVFSNEGNTVRTKRYALNEGTCSFQNAVQANNGDFLIFGLEKIRNIENAIVVRLDRMGKFLWSKRYIQDGVTSYLELIHIGNDEYVFGARIKGKGKTEDIGLIKIDSTGTVIKAINVVPDTDERATGLLKTSEGFVVYGGSEEKRDWDSFFIQFDTNLSIIWSKLVGNGDYQLTKHVLHISDSEFIVTGEHGRTQDSFVYRFDPSQTSLIVNTMDLLKGKDDGFKRLGRIVMPSGDNEFLLAAQSSSTNSPSIYTRIDTNLNPLWLKQISTEDKHIITDLHIHDDGDERVRVSGKYGQKLDGGLLLRTDDQLTVCKATELTTPPVIPVQFKVSNWTPPLVEAQVKVESLKLIETVDETDKRELCPRGAIDLSGETLVQSPFVYLQASGSDGSDDTPNGYHLRWDFRSILADKHIAKGSLSGNFGLYPATYDFNKDDDFVKIYRTPFLENYYSDVDFNTQPDIFNVSGTVREWEYSNITPTGVSGGISTSVIISFPDTAAYDVQAASTNPNSSVIDFLKAYSGEIQVRLNDKPCFRVEWMLDLVNPADIANAKLRYEIVSLNDVTDNASVRLSERNILTEPDFSGTPVAICEDVNYLRFDRENAFTTGFRFYAYIDYLQGTNQIEAWQKINDFALTLNQSKAYKRLENSPTFQIDGKWPKFNEDNDVTGKFKVSVPNYQNRWSNTEGLGYGVERYLDLSQNSANHEAVETIAASPIGTVTDNSTMDVSFFDIVQIAGIDYHMARMLGLGHIDAYNNAQPDHRYIYLMEYDTLGDLNDGGGARAVKHIYMTPHLTIQDYKYPPVPVLQDPPTYGLTIPNGTPNPSLLTDDQGYTPFADIRFVNINRDPFQFEKDFETFFQNSEPFSLCDKTETIALGMEYALQGSPWIQPELMHDREYNDPSGLEETLMIPNTGQNPVFRHQETEEGIHCYALYSVNWFSRPSEVSTEICTDFTKFPKRNTILPPMNLAVQLVQQEAPPILTTSQEQVDYANLSGDKTYLRVTFDWNYIHHQAYQFAQKAQFFFNKQEKRIVKGEILTVTQLTNNRVQITTAPYNIISTSPIQTVQPNIAPGIEDHFAESLFAVGGLNFRVESVLDTTATSGNNPTFILHQIRETNSVETPTGSDIWLTTETYVSPSAGDRFLVAENMGRAKNWDNKLAKSIYLESFSSNDFLNVIASTNNNGKYTILSSSYTGTDTEIEVSEAVDDSLIDGSVEYDKIHRVIGFNLTNNGFLISGDVSADFAGVTDLILFGSLDNDATYTIASANFNGTDTDVIVNESIHLNSSVSCIAIRKIVTIVAYDTANSLIILSGDYTAELTPSYKEIRQNSDTTTTELIMGGLVAECTITEEPDVYNPDNVVVGANPGDPIPGSRSGVYTMTFVGNPLPPHVDPDVSWFQGKVRVLEDDLYLPTPLDTRTDARMKELNVQNVYEDSGNLILIAVDPTYQVDPSGIPTSYTPSGEYVPILTGAGVQVNYHPSYLLYLKVDETQIATGPNQNEFNENSILPSFGEGLRKTFLGIRAVDGINNDPLVDDCASHVGTPAAITAQEIRNPEPPLPPSGPLYATRPDFYGKSTYTMDIGFTNIPYSVLVYKANERKILDTLYKPDTVQTILQELAAIPQPDIYFTDRWNGLVNLVLEPVGDPDAGEFLDYPNSPYRFPIPDNEDYILPESFTTGNIINPFNGTDAPGSGVMFSIPELGISVSMEKAVKDAITGAFISQTEAPMIYEYIVNGIRTSNTPPVIRNENDDLIPPGATGYNAFPFAVKLSGGELRFCDYNIDGGSNSFYFYYAMELSDRQIKSAPSTIVGPIQLVNTRPAKEPSIKRVITQIENQVESIPTAVCFKIEDYVASEGIERIDVYRGIDAIDALTVRTMDLANEVAVNGTIAQTDICDEFSGLDYPLYGEDLHYRLIAMRKITLEDGITTEYIPSEPSKFVRATLVDPNNPPAPCIISENGTATPTELQNVILKWEQVCYNGTYNLQKMNASGNWESIYSIKSNDSVIQYPPIVSGSPDFVNFDATALLPREDEDGNPIYHRFRVQVENSSGLFNLTDCPLTLATGCFDLQAVENYVSYADSNGFVLTDILSQEVDDGANNNPGQMTFTANIPNPLPAGHSSFTQLDITVTDELGNTDTKSITTASGTAVFNDGDGGLQLNGANHKYTIVTKLLTDFCTNGFRKVATLSYVHGPCNDLSNLAQIVEITDGSHTYPLTADTDTVNDGVSSPGSLTFTDISGLSGLTIPQTFAQLDITLTDSLGNIDTKSITSAGGSVTFNNGDGGLVLNDGDVNRLYEISLLLTSVECATGQQFTHSLTYSFNPCDAVQALTDIVSFTDNSGASINPLTESEINNGVHNPGGSITLTDIVSGALPAGHTFASMEVTLFDGIGGFHSLPVTAGGNATFNTGDGPSGSELDLGATNPNPIIGIEINLFTDLCTNGSIFTYDLSYTYDPYEDLGSQTDVVSYLDANGLSRSPLDTSPFNDGVNNNPGGSMTFTELISSNLPAGDTFGSVNITVQDGSGGEFTGTINSVSGSLTINNGQGGLVLNSSAPNKTYTFIIEVISTLCPDGVTFVYTGRYTFGV